MAIARADGDSAQVAARFQVLMRRYANIAQLVRFSLGPYWRDLPASRRGELHRLVERYAGGVFATYRGDFAGRRLEIVGSKPPGPRDTLVTTRIIHDGSRPPSVIEWRILRTSGRMRVFDMKVRGIWLTLLMRSTFVSILKQNRGDMDALFTYLRQ